MIQATVSIYAVLGALLCASNVFSLQQSSPTHSSLRQWARITQWNSRLHAKRPQPKYWNEDDGKNYYERQPPPPKPMDFSAPEPRGQRGQPVPMEYPARPTRPKGQDSLYYREEDYAPQKRKYYPEGDNDGGNYWSNPPARYDPVGAKGQRMPGPNDPPMRRPRPEVNPDMRIERRRLVLWIV